MAESEEDVNTLKRRGRRRLVGAIALVLAAVIVLPMVFDSEPRVSAPPVSVRIPGEEEVGFTPKVTPKSPPPDAKTQIRAAEKDAEKAAEKAPEKAAEKEREKTPEKIPEPAPKIEITVNKGSTAEKPAAESERKRAETALSNAGEQFIVPAGAYADPASVIETLKAAKLPFYTEPVATKQGTVTRVRVGPFAGREAADRALKQMRNLGLKPGEIATKS
jgi:DedD protein